MMNFYYDIPSYEEELRPLIAIPDLMPVALRRALGKTLTRVKTQFVRGVGSESMLRLSRVREGLFQSRVSWDGDEAHGYLGGTRGQQPLFRYKVTPSGPGVRRPAGGASAQVLRSAGLAPIKGSFVAQMKSGHIGIFWRKRGNTRSAKTGNYEIEELFGPSVQFFFQRDSIRVPIEEQTDELFTGFLRHEVSFLTSQWAEGKIQ